MAHPNADLLQALSELAVPLPDAGNLTTTDLSDGLRSRFEDATVIGLGEASHGTEEFFELRFRLIRLLVKAFGVRAVGFEAPFDPLCRVNDLVAAGEGNIRALVAEMDIYRPFKTEMMVALFEWLQSVNASRPPEDRVHVYGFDTTVIKGAANGIEPYLDRVDADVDPSLHEDLAIMTTGYDSEAERQALLESTRRVHATLAPLLEANEAAWVEATSRRAYEHVRHRLHLIETQLEAHEGDRGERMALRDETMAANVEWIHERSTGPLVLWGHNGHVARGTRVLGEYEARAMGAWLADAYGDGYCPVGFELGGGEVAALDADAGEVVEYPIPDPPSASVPGVLRQVDEPLFHLSVEALHDAPSTRAWLRSEPRRHNIWGGTPDGDTPVRYTRRGLDGFDWVFFIRETSPLVHLD